MNLGNSLDLKIRRKIRKYNAGLTIGSIVAILAASELTVSIVYPSSLGYAFVQGLLAGSPLALAFATFYLSVSIARDRRARQMAERVYTPLLKEVTTWLDPTGQRFGEWTRLHSEAPYWVRRIPKDIVSLLNRAEPLFHDLWSLRGAISKLISDATDKLSSEVLSKAGHANDRLGPIQFNVMTEDGTGHHPIYLNWIWETGMSVSEYADDLAKKLYPVGTKWSMQTMAQPRSHGSMQVAGGKEDTMKWLGKILGELETQPAALELRNRIRSIRQLGKEGLLLIGEELDKELRDLYRLSASLVTTSHGTTLSVRRVQGNLPSETV